MESLEDKINKLQIELNGILVEECHLRAKQKELKEKRVLFEQKVLQYGLILNLLKLKILFPNTL